MNLVEVISTQRKGRCLVEAQTKLQELVKTCMATGKTGTLTIKLEIKPTDDDGVVEIGDDCSAKPPKPSTPKSLFYADDQGALHREDPRQPEFAEVTQLDKAQGQ